MIYAIVAPGIEAPLGVMYSEVPPSAEEMADHLAAILAFRNRDALLAANPGLQLGYLIMN